MKITHEFTVPAGVDRAWEVLTDLELIAPCLPGAQITGRDGEAYKGKLKVKVGPVVSEFAGTASFVEKDDTAHVAVIEGKARDARGAGNASATITARLTPEAETSTKAIVEADVKISGKLAQFGSGMIQEVSEKLIGTFVTCLEGKIGAPAPATVEAAPVAAPAVAPAVPASSADAEASTVTTTQADPIAPTMPSAAPDLTPAVTPQPAAVTPQPAPVTPQPVQQQEAEALDLGKYAGGAVAKRAVPVAIGVGVVVVAVIIWVSTR